MLRDYSSVSIPTRSVSNRSSSASTRVHASARKYRVTPETLPDALARASARLEQLAGAADVEAVRRREAEAHDDYLAHAGKLSAGRKRPRKSFPQA